MCDNFCEERAAVFAFRFCVCVCREESFALQLMATDISLAGKRRALSQRGERLISPLSAIVYLAHHSGPNMATSAAARALEKSINPARFCMSVCDGSGWRFAANYPMEKRCTISEHFLVN